MPLFALIFLLSIGGAIVAIAYPAYSDWLLLAVPCALASAVLLITNLSNALRRKENWAIIDGSNVMFWNEGVPKIGTVREVIAELTEEGLTPAVIFDANAGYKISGRFMQDKEFAKLLRLPRTRVLVASKGTPADPLILQSAKDNEASIITNDRFRDWAEDFAEVLTAKKLIRGGYRNGSLWLSFEQPD